VENNELKPHHETTAPSNLAIGASRSCQPSAACAGQAYSPAVGIRYRPNGPAHAPVKVSQFPWRIWTPYRTYIWFLWPMRVNPPCSAVFCTTRPCAQHTDTNTHRPTCATCSNRLVDTNGPERKIYVVSSVKSRRCVNEFLTTPNLENCNIVLNIVDMKTANHLSNLYIYIGLQIIVDACTAFTPWNIHQLLHWKLISAALIHSVIVYSCDFIGQLVVTDYLTISGFTSLNGSICLHSVLDKAGSQSVFKRT